MDNAKGLLEQQTYTTNSRHFLVQGGTGETFVHTLFEGLFSWNAFGGSVFQS